MRKSPGRRTGRLALPAVSLWAILGADHSRPNRLVPERGSRPAGVSQMPNKYEREIEEILRNMDLDDHGQSLGDRIRAFNRPTTRTRPSGPRLRLRLNSSEAFLLIGVVLALVGAGMNYYFGFVSVGLYATIAGLVAVVGLACVLMGLIIGWLDRFGHRAAPTWRGAEPQPRRGFAPFRAIATRFRIMRLKWRYWRSPRGS